MVLIGILVFALVAAWALTGQVRRYALKIALLDRPNARSSHAVPTPRGGGLAVIVVVLAALPLLWLSGILDLREFLAWLGAGALVGLVGWRDDRHDVAPGWRLLAHVAAATWALIWLGGLPPLLVFGWELHLNGWGHALAVLYLVWVLNLYNFMDGIDGIAGIEAVTVGLGAALLVGLALPGVDAWVAPLLLAAAAGGFLIWNFPKARIFLGDSGSSFIGLSLGVLSVHAGWLHPELFWAWILLLGVFVVDATVTLLRRLLRAEPIWQAHRSHAYQHSAQRLGSHVPVSVAVGAINLFWLLPLAALVAIGALDGPSGILIGYLPLIVASAWLGSGCPTTQHIQE